MNAAVDAVTLDGKAAALTPASAWERWRSTRPRLRHSISLHHLHYRGEAWLLLHDRLGREQLRLGADAGRLIERLDGHASLEQLLAQLGIDPDGDPVQLDAILATLTRLHQAGLVVLPGSDGLPALLNRQQRSSALRRRTRWLTLLSPRIHLFDPEPLLGRMRHLAQALFHPLGLLVWAALTLAGLLLGWMHWDALMLFGSQRLDAPLSWALLVCLYPLIKGLHELGHALALKAAGGRVNGIGITLLVFMPVPYVDARAATLLPDRHRRMLVSGAGIMVETLLASLALFLWLGLPDGLPREISFVILTLAGLSTLLFNGNPLLRYDGYYVLSDWLDIPNLASRASALYGYLARRYWLGMDTGPAPHTAPGERPWLLFYAPLSLAYRLLISATIAVFLAREVPSLGPALAFWLLATQWGLPAWRQLSLLLRGPRPTGQRTRTLLRALLGVTLPVGLLALVPLPVTTHVEGVVLMPESSVIRARADGELAHQWAVQNDGVKAGQALFQLADPQLDNEIRVMRGQVRELELEKDALGLSDPTERDLAEQRLAEAKDSLADLLKRQQRLRIDSPADGILQLVMQDRWEGRYLRQGDLLGYVADRHAVTVRVVTDQAGAVRIREGVASVRVRLAGQEAPPLTGRLLRQVPRALERLPSATLGSMGGGAIPVDSRDDRGLKPLEPVFSFDIELPSPDSGRFVGRRAYVTFSHDDRPLLPRLYAAARRALLSQLGS